MSNTATADIKTLFDAGAHVGFSRTTGQITHVTASNVDAERDFLFKCLEATDDLAEHYVVTGFHKHLEGFNGGGDPWRTDGDLYVGVIAESVLQETIPPSKEVK